MTPETAAGPGSPQDPGAGPPQEPVSAPSQDAAPREPGVDDAAPQPTEPQATESPEQAGPEQLTLLELPVRSGSGASKRPGPGAAGQRSGPLEPAYLADTDPVARVRLESHVPHLDRVFDYGVPRDLSVQAQPGVRVRVRFGGQRLFAWVISREPTTDVALDRLQPLLTVQSALPVLTAPVLRAAEAVAERCAGTVADVLRCAVPPRIASVEKQALEKQALEKQEPDGAGGPAEAQPDQDAMDDASAQVADDDTAEGTVDDAAEKRTSDDARNAAHSPAGPRGEHDAGQQDAAAFQDDDAHQEASGPVAAPRAAPTGEHWGHYDGGREALRELGDGQRVRAVVQALPSHPDHDACDLVAEAAAASLAAGRGVVVVVPDHKTLERMQRAVQRRVPEQRVARLHSEDKPTPRYRAFVQTLEGQRSVVIGTRPAVWAPVRQLGLIVVFDDGDTSLVEPRAPYHHARDVALLRAQQEDLSLLVVGEAVTPEAQRLVETGWARSIAPDRSVLRANMPRIVATSDAWHEAHDSLAGRARLPETAFRAARKGLETGPVLVQVARAGYAPVLACERCRAPARCTACDGPLAVAGRGQQPLCTWCGRHAVNWSCQFCSGTRWRYSSVGSVRTAEELGRAFPQVPVLWSSGEQIRRDIGPDRALVVATPGAEPKAEGGYAAALLLDGDRMLSRPGLRVEEAVLRRWVNAAALVRRAADGGVVVVTSEHEQAVGALVRWDVRGHAARELAERRSLSLPPAVRCAAVTGPLPALEAFLELAELPQAVRRVGPAPVEDRWAEEAQEQAAVLPREEQAHRMLLFFSYGAAAEVTRRLRAARAESSALRKHRPVNVRCDVADLL